MTSNIWPERAPSRQSGIDEVKGHNMNETSFAHILFVTGVPGKPRLVGGELHINLKFACLPCTSTVQGLREVPPCGTKAGTLKFEIDVPVLFSKDCFHNPFQLFMGEIFNLDLSSISFLRDADFCPQAFSQRILKTMELAF